MLHANYLTPPMTTLFSGSATSHFFAVRYDITMFHGGMQPLFLEKKALKKAHIALKTLKDLF